MVPILGIEPEQIIVISADDCPSAQIGSSCSLKYIQEMLFQCGIDDGGVGKVSYYRH